MPNFQAPSHDDFLFPTDVLPLPRRAPYQAGEQAMEPHTLELQLQALGLTDSGWLLGARQDGSLEIRRHYVFDGYLAGVNFVHCLAAAAEVADHHPDITLNYRQVLVHWSTHFVKGIHRNDLDMAKYSDALYEALNHRSMS
ncbi:4a-hydroxytetrahydrobiopterin dehydratase [Pseudoteredinibacter isoporae]|uniref:4a-hydroxytetrahydrobiopterin dehydratase n=1 Tax=Pseudoteredinibacter isoporae TaxID=570281 RepID=UPI003102F4AA